MHTHMHMHVHMHTHMHVHMHVHMHCTAPHAHTTVAPLHPAYPHANLSR